MENDKTVLMICCALGWIGAAWTGVAHTLDERVHFSPVVSETQSMEIPVGIQMLSNWIGMKGNEDNIM